MSSDIAKDVLEKAIEGALGLVGTWLLGHLFPPVRDWMTKQRKNIVAWFSAPRPWTIAFSTSLFVSLLIVLLALAFVPIPPRGAVIAFALDGGCPRGWAVYPDAISRVIVGAAIVKGKSPNNDKNGKPLTPQEFKTPGGLEAIVIQKENLPSYDLKVRAGIRTFAYGIAQTWTLDGNDSYPVGKIGSVDGTAMPIATLPPFIPLYYCQKS